MGKSIMDTTLERIQAKIAELEAKIADLRIAERELLALDQIQTPRTRQAKPSAPAAKPKPKLKSKPPASPPAEARQTIGGAITEVLEQHGALAAADIAERIKAAGRDINNRTVSFSLQALKRRGLVKSANGKWTLAGRSRRARSAGGESQETA